ncbi:protein unc-13 4B [Caerostris darwini]|uniref:Protein unc-13 4B n=1 Tax=Caerostris darwini TaxID=1538125 RepID=A0AAV4TDP6_9ARAC|nr:protein unc-13 4B [Caerostris darwini]
MSIVKDELQNKLVEFAGRYEKQTSSVQQSADLIQKEYCEIWELASDANCFECEKFFIHGLHGCCMKYTDALIEQIHLRKLIENFSTTGKNALCAIANDLWAMACFAGNLIEGMGIELQPKYPCTKVSLQMVCKILVSNITQEIKPDIADRIKQ